ncbi:MAG TPA: segregation/condensation protein A [Candidatus Binatia bacterium]|nr:segregation/condensation protein A [Candidatus Binatia bacterium]
MSDPYTVKLEMFEGPLDLLLHLIKKHEVDVYNVRIADITDQYLAYLSQAQDLNLDIAGEFLVMAATLVYLKSRALLPADERDELEDEEPLDPEAELIQQLVEHERFQKVAAALASRPVLGRDVFARSLAETVDGELTEPMRPVTVGELLLALERVLARRAAALVHRVQGEKLDIRDGLRMVMRYLRASGRATFDELFPEDASRMHVVVVFLALLELIKNGAVTATQGEAYGTIDIALVRDVDPDELLAVGTQEGVG